jgi:hypothetical protein
LFVIGISIIYVAMGGNMSQPLEDESMTNLYLLLYYFSFFLLSNNELSVKYTVWKRK